MSSVNLVEAGSSSIMLEQTQAVPNQEMDKDMFMQLLVTQLQYQDPMNPMDNQDMLAQMAQFTSLEQMKNVADVNQKQYANQMIGDYVSYSHVDEATGSMQYLVGKVDYVKNVGSEVFIGIGEHEVALSDIQEIYDSSNIQGNSSAFELIGKTVQAVTETENAETGLKEQNIIEGEVLRVHMKDGTPYVVIGTGDKSIEIELSEVQNIVDQPSLTGKYVTGQIEGEDGEMVEIAGIVEYICIKEDSTYLYVNGEFLDFEKLESVQDSAPVVRVSNQKYNY